MRRVPGVRKRAIWASSALLNELTCCAKDFGRSSDFIFHNATRLCDLRQHGYGLFFFYHFHARFLIEPRFSTSARFSFVANNFVIFGSVLNVFELEIDMRSVSLVPLVPPSPRTVIGMFSVVPCHPVPCLAVLSRAVLRHPVRSRAVPSRAVPFQTRPVPCRTVP